jgi:hypothetical protein
MEVTQQATTEQSAQLVDPQLSEMVFNRRQTEQMK